MKKNSGCITEVIVFLVAVVTVILILSIDKWIFEAIYYSDMPEWLKYFFLK